MFFLPLTAVVPAGKNMGRTTKASVVKASRAPFPRGSSRPRGAGSRIVAWSSRAASASLSNAAKKTRRSRSADMRPPLPWPSNTRSWSANGAGHRTSRAVHQRDLRRQQLIDAVFDDRVRLPAANLHDGPRTRRHRGNGLPQFLDGDRIAVFVEILHD